MIDCQAERLESVSRLAAALSHKLNNSLTYVLNYIFIVKSSSKDEKLVPLIQKMEQGIDRAKSLLHELVDSSAPLSEPLEKVDLQVCTEQELSYLAKTGDKGVQLKTSFQGDSGVYASKSGILRALMILIENAMEAGATKIHIDCVNSGSEVILKVIDNGAGIPPEAAPYIFEPFYTTKPQAQGFGLYLAYHIVKYMCGRISLDAKSGAGTTFVVALQREKPF